MQVIKELRGRDYQVVLVSSGPSAKCLYRAMARCRGHGLHEAGHQQAQGAAQEAGGGRGGAEPPHAHV